MASKTINVGSWTTLTMNVDETWTDINSNSSGGTWSLVIYRKYNISSSATKYGQAYIDGACVWNGSCTVGGSGTKTLASGTWGAGHASDGSRSLGFSFSLGINVTLSGTYYGTVNGSGTATLTTIPRQATIGSVSSSDGKLNGTFSYNWESKIGSYYYRARISIPGIVAIKNINLGQRNGAQSDTFTLATADLTKVLDNVSNTSGQVSIGVVIETYTDSAYSKKLGESVEKIVAVGIPTTISVVLPTPKDNNSTIVNLTGNANYIVQNKSNLTVTVNACSVSDIATTTKKATITKYEVSVNGLTKTLTAAGTLDFGKVTSNDNLLGTLKVTDSRGNTASKTFTVNVIPYSAPKIKIEQCYRSDANDNEDATAGNYAFVKVSFSACSIKVLGVEKNGVKSRNLLIDNVSKSSTFSDNVGKAYGTITNTQHIINVTISDLFGDSNADEYLLRSALLPFVISANKKSIGLGGMSEKDGQLLIGFDEMKIKGKVVNASNEEVLLVTLTDEY